MSFCINCGQQLVNGAKFCFACGTPAGETACSNQRQREWAGKLTPCPSCGENIPSFTGFCPACGHETRGAKATDSVAILADKLNAAKNEQEKCLIIRAFPIPNTREDILEFFILSSTNFDVTHDSINIANAWKIKIEQCYEKARLTLADDPEYFQIEQGYELAYKKVKQYNTKQTGFKIVKGIFGGIGTVLLTVLKGIGKFIGIVFGGLLSFFKIGLDDTGKILSKSLLVILSAIIFGAAIITNDDTNSAGYAFVGGVILILSACTLIRKKVNGAEFFIYALAGCATFYFSKYASDEVGALMILVGAIVIFIVVVDYFVYLHRNK